MQQRLVVQEAACKASPIIGQLHQATPQGAQTARRLQARSRISALRFSSSPVARNFDPFLTHLALDSSLQIPAASRQSSSLLIPSFTATMCPPVDETPANGTNGHAANGTSNGTDNGHEGFTGVQSSHNPHPSHKSPYQPVGDFLSNVSRFKIIGTSSCLVGLPPADGRTALFYPSARGADTKWIKRTS